MKLEEFLKKYTVGIRWTNNIPVWYNDKPQSGYVIFDTVDFEKDIWLEYAFDSVENAIQKFLSKYENCQEYMR